MLQTTLSTVEKPQAGDKSAKRRVWERCTRLLWIFGWLSALLHIWPRDRWLGLSIWFYATPWGVILVSAVATLMVCWLFQGAKHSPLVRRGALALLILSGGMWLRNDWNWADARTMRGDESSSPIRLLVWNIARARGGWERIAREIKRHDPDVVCLVEAEPSNEQMRDLWMSFFPDDRVSMLGGGVVCIVRGNSGVCNAIELTANSRLRILPVEIDGRACQCAIVDIESSIFNSRATPLTRLAEELDSLTGPVVVAGDFNTPMDSVHWNRLSQSFSSAARGVGSGYGATWPTPLPLMALDQVWYNDGIEPLSHSLGWSWASDHRPVIVEFTIKE